MKLAPVLAVVAAAASGARALTSVYVWKDESKMTGGMNAMMNAISRYALNVSMSDLMRRDIALANFNDELYTTSATLGGQTFAFDLDTGSSDVWVRGANCVSTDGSCGVAGQSAFDTAATTATATGNTWMTTYGSGAVEGNIYTGTASLAGITATMNFGVSTQEVGFNSPGAGLWGLAFSALNQITPNGDYTTAAGIQSMAFYFSNWINGDAGVLTMNGVDQSKFSGTLQYVPLSADTYYKFDATGSTFTVNGAATTISTPNGAIADTGTTLLLLPSAAAASINAAIGATASTSTVYSIPCSAVNTGPSITFALSTVSIVISPHEYVISNGDGTCFSGIASLGATTTISAIFGDTFLRAAYTVFDIANNQLGFAQAVHPTAIVNNISATLTALVAATATNAGNGSPAATTTKAATAVAATQIATATVKTKATATTVTSTCAHSVCKVGAALTANCDACAAAVCAADTFCCNTAWDAQCVKEARQSCGACAKN
ncbi:hypothetical protein HDU83_003938 [Entophlyctis luteolus]|nr:hypothetical protein HDU82_004830 [Entophlyctis luteolus]KAJ3345554.1 hypothetical protein HDU83_003938 [Entophlyctis luteolus]KAJ3385235.1 hypothetical protein HDU84_002389 [Entophlyctis sp. JEL0112]